MRPRDYIPWLVVVGLLNAFILVIIVAVLIQVRATLRQLLHRVRYVNDLTVELPRNK